ncbi:MAG: translation initiation factor IF-2 N-terminal domain-containing protein, partial [Prochlorococcaceae cyanobacterium]
MTSSGKVRIYELSRDLGLENKDVLDAAEKLGLAVKSHSSSISDTEASRIRQLLEKGSNGSAAKPAAAPQAKAILTVKKAATVSPPAPARPAPPAPSRPQGEVKPAAPARPQPQQAVRPEAPARTPERPAALKPPAAPTTSPAPARAVA